MLAIGCGGTFLLQLSSAFSAASDAAGEAADTWEVRSFANERGAIEVPSNWQQGQLIEDAPDQLSLSHMATDRHLIVTAIAKVDVTAASLNEISLMASTQLANEMSNVMATDPHSSTINGRPVIDRRIEGSSNGANITVLQRHFEFPEHWLVVRVWTTVSRLDEGFPVFQRILDSVRFE